MTFLKKKSSVITVFLWYFGIKFLFSLPALWHYILSAVGYVILSEVRRIYHISLNLFGKFLAFLGLRNVREINEEIAYCYQSVLYSLFFANLRFFRNHTSGQMNLSSGSYLPNTVTSWRSLHFPHCLSKCIAKQRDGKTGASVITVFHLAHNLLLRNLRI